MIRIVVDLRSATAGIRLLADQALRRRDAGEDAEKIVEEIKNLRSRRGLRQKRIKRI